jgi:peroxiredoxin
VILKSASLLVLAGCAPHLYTNGAGAEDWVPPTNGWSLTEPPADLQPAGWQPGQVAPDFRLTDQFGDDVSLWQFYGNVVLLDVSTMWCAPCQTIAADAEETWRDFEDQGFVYVTVLHEDEHNEPPDLEDVNRWADAFGITAPVLADPDRSGTGSSVTQGQYPSMMVIGRDMVVDERVVDLTDAGVRKAIEASL